MCVCVRVCVCICCVRDNETSLLAPTPHSIALPLISLKSTLPHILIALTHTVVKVLMVPEAIAELSSNILAEFVREQVAVLRDTGGGASTVPRLITDCLKHKVAHFHSLHWHCALTHPSHTHTHTHTHTVDEGYSLSFTSLQTPHTTHINTSQACRQAIKFGDPLTLDECRTIVRNLALCELPFQCAHGRPSVVPILRIRGDQHPPQTAYP